MNFLRNLLLCFVTVPWAFAAIANEYKARSAGAEENGSAPVATAVGLSSQAAASSQVRSRGKSDRLSIAKTQRPQTAVLAVSYQHWDKSSFETPSDQTGAIRLGCTASRFTMSEPTFQNPDLGIETAGELLPANKFQDRIASDAHENPIEAVCLAEDLFIGCEQSNTCVSQVALVRYNM